MNQEVRKAEAELNKALSECEEKLKAAKKHSQNINEMLCQTSQEFEGIASVIILNNIYYIYNIYYILCIYMYVYTYRFRKQK